MTIFMKNKKTNIFLLAMFAASPMMVNAQTNDADTLAAKKKVHVAFRDIDADNLLGGVSYIDMEELQKKDYTMGSLDDLSALVGGWNGNNLWGQDNDRLDNNDNGNLPLVIIDGIKRPSNNVLPSEIEQVTFLKGAQAVVLYGPKGAKGAILITTKRGKVDGLQVKVNANTGWHVAKAFPEYLGSAQYMILYNEACANDGLKPKYSLQEIYNHSSGENPYRYPNLNYYSKDYMNKAYNRSEGTVEIQGGGTRAHFYTNINYYRNGDLLNFGNAKDNYTDRFSVRGNVDLVVNKAVTAYTNVSATFYNANHNKGDFWSEASTMRPNYPEHAAFLIPVSLIDPNASKPLATLGKSLYIIDGQYFLGGTSNTKTSAIANAYAISPSQDVSRQFQFDAGINYDMSRFTKGLSFKAQFAIDYAANYSLSYNNTYAAYNPVWSNYNGKDVIVGLNNIGEEKISGYMSMSDKKYRQTITWNGHFDYERTFAGKHHVTGMLLANMYTTTASGEYHHYTNANLGLQAGYDYMGRYFADISMAGAHSSRLPEGHREAISPSFTLGWNIAKEDFMKDSKVDDLMLSASYSDLNEDIDVHMNNNKFYYLYDASWGSAGADFTWNDGTKNNLTYSTMGKNPVLDFIHRKEFSVNLRGSFFDKLISADITFFNTRMTGYLIQDPSTFPSHLQGGLSNGTFKPTFNHDETLRQGIDLAVTAHKQFGKVDATLGVTATYLTTKNSVLDEVVDEPYRKKEGRPIDAIWGYKCLGFFSEDDFNITVNNDGTKKYELKAGIPTPALGGTIMPGDLKYEDVNNDGKVSTKDQVYLGKNGSFGSPLYLGVNLTLKYNNFTLFVVGNAQLGAYGMRNNSYYYMQGDDKYSINVLGRWTPETAGTAVHPRLTTKTSANNAAESTFWMYSTDRFDLRKVQLTYDFPKEMLAKFKIVNGLAVYINGNDLLTIAKWRPLMETSVGSAPQTRFYNLGVKVTF